MTMLHKWKPEGSTTSVTMLVIQHNEANGPGLVEDLDCDMEVHRSDLDPVLPALQGIDGLIVMGGPQAAYSDEDFPSRRAELDLIAQAVSRGIPVLGVCLGAQLLAVATGGSGYRLEQPEVGYFPVTLTSDGRFDPLLEGVPISFSPRHKHFDSYEMPPGAVRLASSEMCREQGFRLGDKAWGLQFHFEMKPVRAEDAHLDPERAAAIAALAPTAKRILSNFSTIVHQSALS